MTFEGADGRPVNWHIFDTGSGPAGTIVCVHGNPTWAYHWRGLLETLTPQWRVIAVDQTSMGFSERTSRRLLKDRVAELVTFCRQEAPGPVVLAAHDWGGPVAIGAAGHLEVRALVLANTAVAKPDGVEVPPLIAAARSVVDLTCRRTPAFVAGTSRMTEAKHRDALRAPYRNPSRREAVRDFVADIPVRESDPSFAALAQSAAVLDHLEVPTLIVWGGRDPVFHDRFLRDLRRRIPHAEVQRYPEAGHLVCLDEHVGPVVQRWLAQALRPESLHESSNRDTDSFRSIVATLAERSSDRGLVYEGPDGTLRWDELAQRSHTAAQALRHGGLRRGERVALLIPPSAELLVATAALWRIGAVPVVADSSAGLKALRRTLRAAAPTLIIGTASTLAAAAGLRLAPAARRAAFASLPLVLDLRSAPDAGDEDDAAVLHPDDLAAVVHTSGATGPAKPVRYTHGALASLRDMIGPLFSLQPGDAFTTSFGPFMLLAPVLGMVSIRPDFDVNDPSALGFDELREAVGKARVTTAWLSPASARAIVATAAGRQIPLDLVMLAGAPIPRSLVTSMSAITGGEVRTPYGMTECLPVTDGSESLRVGPHGGFATGRPIDGCLVRIGSLEDPSETVDDGAFGEILVSAPWMFDGYDGAWLADEASVITFDGIRFHRTGDVGYLDDGVVFHLGRLAHVITAASGPLASIAIEDSISAALGRSVAAVGIGPAGAQVVAIVVESAGRLSLAENALRTNVRAATATPVAAVLTGPLPVDRRHLSKIDRSAVAAEASAFLAGR